MVWGRLSLVPLSPLLMGEGVNGYQYLTFSIDAGVTR